MGMNFVGKHSHRNQDRKHRGASDPVSWLAHFTLYMTGWTSFSFFLFGYGDLWRLKVPFYSLLWYCISKFCHCSRGSKQTPVHEALSPSLELFAVLGDHHSPCVCVKSLLSEPPQELELLNPEFPWGSKWFVRVGNGMEVISSNPDQVSGVWKLLVSGATSSVKWGGDLSLCVLMDWHLCLPDLSPTSFLALLLRSEREQLVRFTSLSLWIFCLFPSSKHELLSK